MCINQRPSAELSQRAENYILMSHHTVHHLYEASAGYILLFLQTLPMFWWSYTFKFNKSL